MNSKILILGKDGQFGRALVSALGTRAIALGRSECDFLNPDFTAQIESHISQPVAAVINAAAYTHVDKAEHEEREIASRINTTAVSELAAWCKRKQLPLVHFSTDYVFDGSGQHAHKETEAAHPINGYGESKLAGEHAVTAHAGAYLIIRTSWLYDAQARNFFTAMRRLMREKEQLNVVADQMGAPTYAPDLAKAALSALHSAMGQTTFPSGVYHLCNGGQTSWYGFSKAMFEYEKSKDPNLKCQGINAIPSSKYLLPARRPLNSRLDCAKARNVLGVSLPDWEAGLQKCLIAA